MMGREIISIQVSRSKDSIVRHVADISGWSSRESRCAADATERELYQKLTCASISQSDIRYACIVSHESVHHKLIVSSSGRSYALSTVSRRKASWKNGPRAKETERMSSSIRRTMSTTSRERS